MNTNEFLSTMAALEVVLTEAIRTGDMSLVVGAKQMLTFIINGTEMQ